MVCQPTLLTNALCKMPPKGKSKLDLAQSSKYAASIENQPTNYSVGTDL